MAEELRTWAFAPPKHVTQSQRMKVATVIAKHQRLRSVHQILLLRGKI